MQCCFNGVIANLRVLPSGEQSLVTLTVTPDLIINRSHVKHFALSDSHLFLPASDNACLYGVTDWDVVSSTDPNVHALLWMAEAAIDMIGIAIGFEGTKSAVNYFFLSRSSSQKKKSS